MCSSTLRILVVEDDNLWRGTFQIILEGAGYQVDCAATGAEAFALFEAHGNDYAAMIMDGNLGRGDLEGDTLRFTRHVRANGFSGPIFAVSVNPMTREKQMQAGCDYSLEKWEAKQKLPTLIATALPKKP